MEDINNRNQTMPKERAKEQNGEYSKTITIVKPDLSKSRYFNSKHTTPDISME
jgi:hypothetical protein